jgi:hypothetical protein
VTTLRSLTVRISDVVVEYASPGCKDWAEGLAREVAFIRNDWAALGWALGSTRVLLDRREAPIASLSEIPGAAQRLAEEIRCARFGWIFPFLMSLNYGLRVLNARSQTQRVGCWLVVFACLYMGIFLRARFPREKPYSADVGVNAIYYRLELERLLGYYSKATTVLHYAVVLLAAIGIVLAKSGGFREHPIYGVCLLFVCSAILALNRVMARKYQRRIHELDALLASVESAS